MSNGEKTPDFGMFHEKCVNIHFYCMITIFLLLEWGEWQAWGECTASCGEGIRNRIRTCLLTQGACEGASREQEDCTENPPCPPGYLLFSLSHIARK